jgi:hypothetical protein
MKRRRLQGADSSPAASDILRISYGKGHMLWRTWRLAGADEVQFMSALVLALCAIIPASAETAGRHPPDMPVVGWLVFRTDTIARDGLWQGLHELGYVELVNEGRKGFAASDRLGCHRKVSSTS